MGTSKFTISPKDINVPMMTSVLEIMLLSVCKKKKKGKKEIKLLSSNSEDEYIYISF